MFCMKHTSNNNNTLALPQPCNSHQHYRTYVNFVLVLNKHSRRFHHWFAFGNRFYLRARCPRFTKTLFYRWKLQFLQKPYFFCTSSCFTHTTPSTTAIVIQLNVFREKESLVYEDAMTLKCNPNSTHIETVMNSDIHKAKHSAQHHSWYVKICCSNVYTYCW